MMSTVWQRQLDCQFEVDLCNCFATLVIMRLLLSPIMAGLNYSIYPVWEGGESSTFECAWVLPCTLQLWRPEMEGKKKMWEGWPQWRGGVKFICTQKWCMCRPRTTQLDPVSVNTDPTLSHTNTAEEEADSRLTLLSFFSSSFPLFSFAVTRFIAFLRQSIS